MISNPDEHQLKSLQSLMTNPQGERVIEYLKDCLLELDVANRNLEGVRLNRSQGAALTIQTLLTFITNNHR